MSPDTYGLYRTANRTRQEAKMRRLIESLTPIDRSLSWTWIGGMFAFYVAVMAVAATLYANHETRANREQKTGATVATGSGGERGALRSLQHVVHYRDDAKVIGSE
jgi:hypothetical protein